MRIAANKLLSEIDISKQASVLRFLRYTDYALVLLCGSFLMGLLSALITDLTFNEGLGLIFILVSVTILSFSVYTGYRHLGVIDPRVWQTHLIVLPILFIACGLFVALFLLNILINGVDLASGDKFIKSLEGIFYVLWIATSALMGTVCVLLLRNMRIASLGITLNGLLSALRRKKSRRRLGGKKRVNVSLGVLSGLSGIAIIIGMPLVRTHGTQRGFGDLALIFLGWFLLVRARRYFQVTADSLLSVDHREPILFLRSFDDDKPQSVFRPDKDLLDFSLETRLANHFNQFGPFIAVGSPTEDVPHLGAARKTLSDAEWQWRVTEWMSEANLILMYLGKTYWINWEMAKIIEKKRVSNLILLVPELKRSRFDQTTPRFECIKYVFSQTIWSERLLEVKQFHSVRAMLFRADGSVVVIRSRPRNRDSYHLAALVAHYVMLNYPASADETMTHCLAEGSLLPPLYDPPATRVIPPPQITQDSPVNIPRYLAPVIISVFFFLPLAIVAILYAYQVKVRIAAGDIDGARSASHSAKVFGYIAIGYKVAIMLLMYFVRLVAP
jgi:hypothetical protein